MAGLVDVMAQRQAASRPKGAILARATQSGGPPPTSGSIERPGNNGSQSQRGGVFNMPIFTTPGTRDTRPNGPAQDWTVNGPNGENVPFGDWPNQGNDYASPDELARQREARRQAQNAIDMYRNSLDSGIAGINDTRAALMRNQAAANGAYGNIAGAYQRQLQNQLAEAGLDIKTTDIQQANFPQWYQFLAEQWGNRMTAGKHELDYIAQQQVNSANQRLIEWQNIQQGKKEVGQQAQRATRDATSAATVSGVIQGAKTDFADIDVARGNALYGLDQQDKESRLNETQRRQELANRRHQLIGDLNSFDISTREQQARLREREQLLGIEAQRARLKPAQLMDNMNVTMARLGLERTMSTGQFLEAMANASAQERALIDAFMRNASGG